MKVLAVKHERDTVALIQLIPEALKFPAVQRRTHVGVRSRTFVVPVTSTFAAGRRTSGARLIISTVQSAVSGRGATIFAALAATFFRVPAFIFIGGRHILPL